MDAPKFVDMSDQSWEKWHGIEYDDADYKPARRAPEVVTSSVVEIRGVSYSGDEAPACIVQTTLPEGWRNLP